MKRLLSLIVPMLFIHLGLMAEEASGSPKLVVGIVVDQMRWDYLKYYDYTFGDNGFRRLLSEGHSCDNCLIDYVPTVTAAGHSSVYSGSIPAINGIVGNNFYVGSRKTYCAEDSTVSVIGSPNEAVGRMSPRNLRVTTMADALKMSQDFKSKTIGISLKDRGAILPAGHSADAAYWYDYLEGIFVSSSYYLDELPLWVRQFNQVNKQDSDIRYTPKGNSLVADLAIAALKGENLGKGSYTDFLCISFSSTDYIGHRYGTRSPQTEDVYRQLDGQIASLLSALDSQVGKGNYLLFLTADHAAAHNADLMTSNGIPAGRWMEDEAAPELNDYLKHRFGTEENLVRDILEYRIYLDHEAIERSGINLKDVKMSVISHLEENDTIAYAIDFEDLYNRTIPQEIKERIIRGYNPKRSGDIQIVLQPGYYGFGEGSFTDGTTHAVWCPYDSHIPLIFMGWNVPNGRSGQKVSVTDIAATICLLLSIQVPDGCVGSPIIF